MTDHSDRPDAQGLEFLIQFYGVERGAGSAVQNSIVVIWVAATTYFTAAFAALALIFDGATSASDDNSTVLSAVNGDWTLLYWLPLPACALAGYHMILFGTAAVRSRSIDEVEQRIVDGLGADIKEKWERKDFKHFRFGRRPKGSIIGSRAETDWTNLDKATWPMKIISTVALSVPYLSAAVLVYFCLSKLYSATGFDNCMYIAAVSLYSAYGMLMVVLFCQSFRNLL